jgi:hypothetical protein
MCRGRGRNLIQHAECYFDDPPPELKPTKRVDYRFWMLSNEHQQERDPKFDLFKDKKCFGFQTSMECSVSSFVIEVWKTWRRKTQTDRESDPCLYT